MDRTHIKKKMISLLIPTPILETIDDLGISEDRSRSAMINRLVQTGLKSYDYKRGDSFAKQ